MNIDFSNCKVNLNKLNKEIENINKVIYSAKDTTGKTWVKWPVNYDVKEVNKMIKLAKKVRETSDVLLVIGIGGSYLGAKAGLDMLDKKEGVEIIFTGICFDPTYMNEVLEYIKDKEVFVNVVSKSGTTVEILSTLNVVENFMKKKYGEDYLDRFVYTTDLNKGYLRALANKDNVETLCVPDDMGGRYSVLSAVGLFPFAVAKININKILEGALAAYNDLNNTDNDAIKYAKYRYLVNTKLHKSLELFTTFNYKLSSIAMWAQQLFCESEGKEGKGMFISPLFFSRDLHSVGQFIQQGTPNITETFLKVNVDKDLKIKDLKDNSPIKFLEGKGFNEVNEAAYQGTLKAHVDAKVPTVTVNIDKIDEYNFGYLVYFFELACAYSAYLLKVNPFDQPGVEQYKSYMKELLK